MRNVCLIKTTRAQKKNYLYFENYALINLEAIMVLPDFIKMYPSADAAEAVERVGTKYDICVH